MSGPVLNERVTYERRTYAEKILSDLGTVLHIGEKTFWVLLDQGRSLEFELTSYGLYVKPVPPSGNMYAETIWYGAPDNPATAVNDHVCPSCKNDRCSKTERTCWKCGGSLC